MVKKRFMGLKAVAAVLALSVVMTGCSNAGGGTGSKSVNNESKNSSGAEVSQQSQGTDTGDKTELTYLAWNMGTEAENNIERRMIKEFENQNQDVTVKIMEVPLNADGTNGSYDEYMNTLASKKALPDVFMWANVPETAINAWAADVSAFTANDAEYANVIDVVREGGVQGGKTFGIPYAMHISGITQNYKIFDELNVPLLDYDYTIEELVEKIAATTTEKYRGTDEPGILDWGSLVLNDTIGFGTFDGEKYNFSSPEFAKIIGIYQNIIAKGYSGHSSFIKPAAWLPEGVTWAWGEGYVAVQREYSWFLGGVLNGERPFDSDMIPLPGEKIVVVPDYIFVSETSANQEKAYALCKWMSFSSEGLKHRNQIKADNADLNGYSGVPLNAGTDEEIDNFFLEDYEEKFPNFCRMYRAMKEKPENVYIENYKIVPGYPESRMTADTGVVGTIDGKDVSLTMDQLISAIVKGEKQLADYAVEMDKIANQILADKQAKLG